MKNKLNKLLPKSEFARNVLTLMTGAVIAQVIPVIISPVLSRLYDPSEFGEFALFSSIVFILGGISSLTYETAIILPKEEIKAKKILVLSFIISFLFFLIFFIVSTFFSEEILSFFQGTSHIRQWIHVLPFAVLFYATFQSMFFWLNRKKKYKILSSVRVLQSILNGLLSISLGFLGMNYWGLVLGLLIALFCVFSVLVYFVLKDIGSLSKNQFSDIKIVAKEYSMFPKYSTLSTLFNSLTNIGFPIIITFFFGTAVAGGYFFASKIVRMPLNFLFTSFSQVYREKASALFYSDKLHLLELTKRIQWNLTKIMLPVLILISALAPLLFDFLFGNKWGLAGSYVKYFSIFIFFNGLYSPISAIGDILKKQKFLLFFNISLSFCQIFTFYLCREMFSFETQLLFVSILGSLHFIYIDFYMKKELSKKTI